MSMTQVLPGQTITTVSYGKSDNGFPMFIVATAEGDIWKFEASGYAVDEEFTITIIQ